MKIRLADIAFDAGTQIRAAIDSQVVSDYADAMTAGAEFPPLVVFHDGNQHYLADGFHRFMAAQRLEFREFAADVRAGTKEDALWFALGANRTNGRRLTEHDKSHAVEMALRQWPNRLHGEIATQVGCSESLVSKVSTRFTGAAGKPVLTGLALQNQEKRETVKTLAARGLGQEQIAKQANVSKSFVSKVRAEMGLSQYDRTKQGIVRRVAKMREMASEGHTSRQIAAATGLTDEGCRNTLKREGIDVPADKAVGHSKRHDANRIVESIVQDAENLTEGTNLIDFAAVDQERLGEWIDSLVKSRRALDGFIKRLMKEQKNGQAA